MSLSCCFGCPMEGDVPLARCSTGARASSTKWARTASRCATPPAWPIPGQVAELTRAFRERWPATELTLHFHNTRGMGLANVLAGDRRRRRPLRRLARRHRRLPLCAGRHRQRVQRGDRARAGADGLRHRRRPAAPDRAAKRLPALIGHDIPSQIVKAGRRLDLHPVPADFDAIRERALARDLLNPPSNLETPGDPDMLNFQRRHLVLLTLAGLRRRCRRTRPPTRASPSR